MPTPYGSRGGLAFSADELRVLRRALGHALHPTPLDGQDVRDCLRLSAAVEEAAREGDRLRAFVLADLARYRASLPGAAAGYLELLREALAAGYVPRAEDLAALRGLRATPAAAALLARCEAPAGRSARTRSARPRPAATTAATIPAPAGPRARLFVLPGGRSEEEGEPRKPQPPKPSSPTPAERPVPKPSEVFPPRRRPAPPPSEKRVAG
ncbi:MULTISPECIES: hypothetical protein [Streptomyces]|uniref:Uncharacterized protein n=2 Tax=Streptomyces TaxID=1883 RepID=A0A100Y581_9ACTN|nr:MULTISPECIES: hypothetical protein [Streptomyces]KUH37886.1 hypothetical protein ATE80_15705 [Streptomyces kanasensis]UUS32322.1 hypothetical protein NRO40_16885 [Streptomyces changanensis]